VILVDANVLLYATNESMALHQRARHWVEDALNASEAIGFAWVVLLAFIRISTLGAFSPQPLLPAQALEQVDAWLAAGPSVLVHPTPRHAAILAGLLLEAGTAGNLVSDAHLACLAIEHGATLCSFDRDLTRFRGVRVVSPP
jgi:toxin-antitoxin system PIN domain toxin